MSNMELKKYSDAVRDKLAEMQHNTLLNRKKAAMSLTPIIMLVVGLIVLLIGIGIVSAFVGNATFTANFDDQTKFIVGFFGVFMALGGLVLIAGSLYAMTKGLFGGGGYRGGRRY